MGLPWIRLDTTLADNPKILGLLDERDGHRAAFVWVCCLTYSGKHGTDGFIPKAAMPFVHGRAADFTPVRIDIGAGAGTLVEAVVDGDDGTALLAVQS